MNSVGIAELNVILVFLFSVEKKETIHFWKFLEIVFVLVFSLVWRLRKTNPEVEKMITCLIISPEVF